MTATRFWRFSLLALFAICGVWLAHAAALDARPPSAIPVAPEVGARQAPATDRATTVALADPQPTVAASAAAPRSRLWPIAGVVIGIAAALVILAVTAAQWTLYLALFAFAATRLLTRLGLLPERERREGWRRAFNAFDDPEAIRPPTGTTKADRARRRRNAWIGAAFDDAPKRDPRDL